METRSDCPSLHLSFSVTCYRGLNGLSDLLQFGLADIYRKFLSRILLLSNESILITYLLAPLEQSPSSEANGFSSS